MRRSAPMYERAVRGLAGAFTMLAGLCLILMMIQIVVDVVTTYVLNNPIEGNLAVVSYYYMVAVVFLPLAMVEFRHEHINVDLFVRHLPHRSRSYLYAFTSIISSIFFGILGYQTLLDAIEATARGDFLMGGALVVTWPGQWTLPIGFFLIMSASLIHAWHALRSPDCFDPSPDVSDIEIRGE